MGGEGTELSEVSEGLTEMRADSVCVGVGVGVGSGGEML